MKQNRRAFVRTLFVATQAVAASRFLPSRLLADEAERVAAPGDFNFIIFGDWGRHGEQDQTEVAEQMAKEAEKYKPRFVVSVGDNFYENGVASATDPQWQTSFEKVYHHDSLQIPWHVILGNHDYNGNSEAQLEYARTSSRWHMPARYYSQTHRIDANVTADFFYLDTSPMIRSYHTRSTSLGRHVSTQDVKKQLEWFEGALAASQATWKIVIGHHPIYSGGEHGDSHDLIRDILPLLHEHNVHAWFNGHDHDLQHLVEGDLNFFCTGAGSQVRLTGRTSHTKFARTQPGFTSVTLQADRMQVRMVDNSGRLLYSPKPIPVKPV